MAFGAGFRGRRPIEVLMRPLDRIVEGATGDSADRGSAWRRYAGTALALCTVTAVLWPFKEDVGLLNIGLVFLIVVVGAAALGGLGAGLFASLLGFVLFDFFLVPPYLTLLISGPHNILALGVFLSLSVLISNLIARARQEAARAQHRAQDLQRLYALNQAALTATGRPDILQALVGKVVELFPADAGWILLAEEPGAGLQVAAQAPARAAPPDRQEANAAQQAYSQGVLLGLGRRTGRGSPDRPRTLFAPLRVGTRMIGVLGVTAGRRVEPFAAAEQTVLATLADQVALAIERMRLLDEANRAELLARTDELKSALIQAVSHDLRTPLASIKAAVSSLLDPHVSWDAATQRAFLEAVDEECDRLTRLVGNLLDMSRIEGGGLHLERDWYPIREVIGTVRRRLADRLADHPLDVQVAPDLPPVPLDFVKIEQVLTNLLENAIKYTPAGTPITIRAEAWNGRLAVSVADHGPGVPRLDLAHLFDKFYRMGGAGRAQGSGLGLSIARGMVEAHGGSVSARSGPGEGLTVTFTLPLTLDGAQEGEPASAPPGAA